MAAPAFGTAGAALAVGSGRTTSAVPVPASVASGDLIFVHLYLTVTSAVTPPAGFAEITFSPVPSTTTAVTQQRVFWKIASGADSGTYSFTHASATTEGVATRYTGALSSGTPFEIIASATRSSSGTTTPAVSGSTGSNDRLLVFGGTSNGTGAWTPPTGFTERYDNSGDLEVSTLTQATQGATGSLTATSGSGFQTATLLALIAPQASTPSDNLGLTDALAQTSSLARAPSDPENLTDSLSTALGRNPSDPLNLTDSLIGILGRNPSDAENLTDALAQLSSLSRPIPDAENLSDALNAQFFRQDITDYNFVLADDPSSLPWVPFGLGQAIELTKFAPGGFDVRNQDIPSVNGDYMTFGTDYHTPPLWSWAVWTNQYNPGDARDFTEALRLAWENAVRKTPNGVTPLRYRLDGATRRVYGRPRRFTPNYDKINMGKVSIVLDFQLSEDLYYDDAENAEIVQIASGWTGSSGVILPTTLPWVFSTEPAPRVGMIQIGGTTNTWVDCTINGPITNPWVQIGLLTFGLVGTVPLGKSIRLSGKPWQMGVYMSDDSWHPEMLDPRSRLSQLQMAPGLYPVTYGGADNTGTSSVTVSWRNAHTSP